MTCIETNLRSLSKLAAECQRQVERLYHVDSLTVQKEVAELVKTNIRCLEQDIKVTRLLAEEEDREASKISILNRLQEYENHLQTSSRQAILRSTKRVNEVEKKNRQELFGGVGKRGKNFTEQFELKQRGVQRGQQDDQVLRASSDVTEALKRTSTLMQQELEKSTFSASMLAESSKTLSTTYSEYQNLGSLVHISKRVITQLESSDWFDRLLLLFGLLLFCGVVFYIIKKRTWDVGISWVSWLTQTKKTRKVIQVTTTIMSTPTILIRDEL
ncbi:hypothetical protein HPULCUR_000311 [Helicostylum pulchrum]|uniref:Sec20 C-terminal domain-containing protein n=1 Tax=Helicostylum pulchrum TaxID=562976 RepID=A0ABP9XJJ3_9FUNG